MSRITRFWLVFALFFVVFPLTLDPLFAAVLGAAVPWPHDWLLLIVVNLVLAWSLARWVAGSRSGSEYNTRP